MTEKIIILDFGSQVTQLIARRVREIKVYCEIHPYNKIPVLDDSVKGIILSGSPCSVRDADSPSIDLTLFGDRPVLGICYGAQLLAHLGGGSVQASAHREYGRAHMDSKKPSALLNGLSSKSQVWMSHGDTIMELPTDYTRGLDFNVKKSSKGGYADYSTSNWARRETALTEAEQTAIEAHGLFNLADFLPKKPSEAELRIIKEMFEASVEGQPYDPARWGQYYRPWGVDAPSGSTTQTAPTAARVAPVVASSLPAWEEDVSAAEASFVSSPVVVPKANVSSDKAQDILAMIRSRQSKS